MGPSVGRRGEGGPSSERRDGIEDDEWKRSEREERKVPVARTLRGGRRRRRAHLRHNLRAKKEEEGRLDETEAVEKGGEMVSSRGSFPSRRCYIDRVRLEPEETLTGRSRVSKCSDARSVAH